MSDIQLVQTCGACPEQYDAYVGDDKVGYLRLRHGHFTVRLHGPDGPLVHEATPAGDGIFEEGEREFHLHLAKNALQLALQRDTLEPLLPALPEPMGELQPIRGGWHVKNLPDGRCVDVLQQLYNWRLVLSASQAHDPSVGYEHGWCYFGHGVNAEGKPRTMDTAFNAAMVGALLWNGEGTPLGYDKEAF